MEVSEIIIELNKWATGKKLEFMTMDVPSRMCVEFIFCNRKTDWYVSVPLERFKMFGEFEGMKFLNEAKKIVEIEMVWE